MKNKKLTYFLGFAVLMVWGLIIYRVFAAAGGDDSEKGPAVTAVLQKEPYNDYTMVKDTTRLLLNYRDPFGLVKQKDTAELPLKRILQKRGLSSTLKPAFNWGFIRYSGYIRNPGSKKLIALVSINGKDEMFSEGETKDHVKLIKNLRDSIRISFNGKTKFITIKPPAL
jgi:hypothetical protein